MDVAPMRIYTVRWDMVDHGQQGTVIDVEDKLRTRSWQVHTAHSHFSR